MGTPQSPKDVGGVSANSVMIPILTILSVLHIIIIILSVSINTTSNTLTKIMRDSGEHINEATSLLAGSSLMSETSSNFILLPEAKNGAINIHPLIAYANELSVPRRGNQVLARFREYGEGEEVIGLLSAASNDANKMMERQLHAIALVRSVYPLPDMEPLNKLPAVNLTDAEKTMTNEQKLAAAEALILNPSYARCKQSVSKNVNNCVKVLRANSEKLAAETGKKIFMLRTGLWVVTLVIIGILIVTFATFYRQLLTPLGKFVRLITSNKSLDEKNGMHEVRMVATAYNSLLRRRDALDDILRSAAETDTLTNLPNRYRFERYLLDVCEEGNPVAILMFDVNYLKQTNDQYGHLAGDKLLKRAARCISSCFGEDCFRIGGDEFAAIVKNCQPEKIQQMIQSFKETEQEEDVSISLGYSYTEEIDESNVKNLIDEADKKMYENKKIMHAALQ